MESMTATERERLLNYLAETRLQLLQIVQGLSPAQLDYRPNPGRWSVAQVVEHLGISEELVLRGIEAALKSPDPAKQSAWQGRDDAFVETLRTRATRVQAIERVLPAAQLPHAELLPRFEAARRRTIDFATTTNAPLRSACFPHPVLGELDGYQWLLSNAAHSERHIAQIRELMADENFPRASAAV